MKNSLGALISVILCAHSASADEGDTLPRAVFDTSESTQEPPLLTEFGMSLGAGGGARGFVDREARNAVETAVAWDIRLLLGTRTLMGLEIAYLGSSGNIRALGLDSGATLLCSGLEGAVRLRILPGMWQPYALVGAGWNRYQITNEDYNTSSIEGSDDLVSFPLGAGLALQYERLVIDARGIYRSTAGADLIPTAESNMDSWAADLSAGFEF